MSLSCKPAAALARISAFVDLAWPRRLHVRTLLLVVLCFWLCSCTLLRQSPYLFENTVLPNLRDQWGLQTSESGQVPYQKWRIAPWHEDMRYVWMVGHHDFRKYDKVELILYFHGMHSKDYYQAFRKELESLAEKRPNDPFLFVGFVDSPFLPEGPASVQRWKALAPAEGERPERLSETVNRVYKAFQIGRAHV